uniref:polypeptide N-acetylgalactosaminyltransferase n=1 Tax=Pundamilia nyererei TaxID=303518 RepID=A0A3B4GTU4_9CICH
SCVSFFSFRNVYVIFKIRCAFIYSLSFKACSKGCSVCVLWWGIQRGKMHARFDLYDSLTLQLQNDLLKSHCVDQGPVPGNIPILHECHFQQPQHCYYNTDGEIIIGGITSHNYNSDRCLVDPGSGSSPTLQECPLAKTNELHMHWDFKQDLAIINKATNRCLEIAQGANLYYELIIQQCSGQSWRIEHLVTSF